MLLQRLHLIVFRIMVNLSINDYFEVMRHPERTYLDAFCFLAKYQDLPFT